MQMNSFLLLLGAHDQWLGVEQDQLPCESRGTSSGNCQETETCTVQAYRMPGQSLQNHLSRHLGGWVTLCSAEEMLEGQHQRVDISAHARTAHKGLLRKRLKEDLCWIVLHVPWQPNWWRDWTELNWTPSPKTSPVLGLLFHTLFSSFCHVYELFASLQTTFCLDYIYVLYYFLLKCPCAWTTCQGTPIF